MSLGIHVSKETIKIIGARNYSHAMEILHARFKMTTFQIFVVGPHNSTPINMEGENFTRLTRNGFKIYAHASYTTTLNTDGLISLQLSICSQLELSGLVLHFMKITPDAHCKRMVAISEIVRNKNYRTKPIYEIKALKNDGLPPGQSCTLETPEKLNYLIKQALLHGLNVDDCSFCVDSAHVWAGGYNLQTSQSVRNWFAAIDPMFMKWIKLIHLNDSKNQCNYGKDEHASIGTGVIWHMHSKQNPELRPCDLISKSVRPDTPAAEPGFVEFLRIAKQNSMNVILEQHGDWDEEHQLEFSNCLAVLGQL